MTHAESSVARLEGLLAEQAALRRVATLVAGDPHPGRLFAGVCEEVGRVLDVESTNITRFEDDGTQTVVGAWAASGAPWFPKGENVPIDGETVTGKLHRSGQPERVDDYSGVRGELVKLPACGRHQVRRRRAGHGRRQDMGRHRRVERARPPPFRKAPRHRLADFAELVTAALANVDAREQLAASRARIVQAGYEERRRLGRDLHDGAQQELVGAVMSLKLAQRRLAREPRRGAVSSSAEALEHMETGIRDLRELAAGIHPSVLTDRGLGAALEALAARSPVPVRAGGGAPTATAGPGRDVRILRGRRGAHERRQARTLQLRPRRACESRKTH